MAEIKIPEAARPSLPESFTAIFLSGFLSGSTIRRKTALKAAKEDSTWSPVQIGGKVPREIQPASLAKKLRSFYGLLPKMRC